MCKVQISGQQHIKKLDIELKKKNNKFDKKFKQNHLMPDQKLQN